MFEPEVNDVFLIFGGDLSVAEATALNFELAFELGRLRPGSKRYVSVMRSFRNRLEAGHYNALKASVRVRPAVGPAEAPSLAGWGPGRAAPELVAGDGQRDFLVRPADPRHRGRRHQHKAAKPATAGVDGQT